MKLHISLFSFLLFFSIQIFAQSNENEIVIASEKFNIQNIQEIKANLLSKPGLTYKGYCEDQKVILILIEDFQYNLKSVLEAISTIVAENSLLIKEGGFDAAYKVCNDKDKMHLK